MKVFFRKKTTEQYPENRKTTLVISERFRGTLCMPHNEHNEHRCIACGLCQNVCPNDTIDIVTEMIETPEGKKKKILNTYHYDLGACMFCQLCTKICPQDAITFDQRFEHAVFTRDKLKMILNHPGSKVIEKQ